MWVFQIAKFCLRIWEMVPYVGGEVVCHLWQKVWVIILPQKQDDGQDLGIIKALFISNIDMYRLIRC